MHWSHNIINNNITSVAAALTSSQFFPPQNPQSNMSCRLEVVLLACGLIVRCCFSGKDARLSLQTSTKHTHRWTGERRGNGFNLPRRHPAGAVNKMCLQPDPQTANVCILHLLNPHYLAVIKAQCQTLLGPPGRASKLHFPAGLDSAAVKI